MPERREVPPTEEGWYALHDFRTIDWDAWREAPEREATRAREEAVDFLESHAALEDADAGATAVYSILGHKADLLLLHLRPTTAHLDAIERRFETTDFARFTDQPTSYVSVTEASGYTPRAREYFEGDLDPDSGLAKYIRSRLHPTVPDATHVCFYPMDKRRDPDQNWYDTPFDVRAEHMEAHGEIGRDYAGTVTQMITGSIGLDDWEWGVTLWAEDMVDVKDLLYEMRFDPSTSQFADFGPFYVGRRFSPADLPAFLAGDPVPTDATGTRPGAGEPAAAAATGGDAGGGADADAAGGAHPGTAAAGDHPHGDDGTGEAQGQAPASGGDHPDGDGGGRPEVSAELGDVEDIDSRLAMLGLHEGEDFEAGDYAAVAYSEADATDLAAETDDLASNFDHYDRHVATHVRAHKGRSAAVSIWTAKAAAETAAGFMRDLPGVTELVGGSPGGGADEGEAAGEQADAAAEPAGTDDAIQETLAAEGIYAGQPHGEDVYALVLYSGADPETLFAEVEDLREGFDRYDTHVKTAVYETTDDGDAPAAVVSLWATESGAETAGDFLADLPEVIGRPSDREGFGTMGMFYTVEPEHREDFVAKFAEVGQALEDIEGHRETALLANREDENDMFIASRWDARETAMDFFRSEAFADTVDWGRDVLADTPRHVFLA